MRIEILRQQWNSYRKFPHFYRTFQCRHQSFNLVILLITFVHYYPVFPLHFTSLYSISTNQCFASLLLLRGSGDVRCHRRRTRCINVYYRSSLLRYYSFLLLVYVFLCTVEKACFVAKKSALSVEGLKSNLLDAVMTYLHPHPLGRLPLQLPHRCHRHLPHHLRRQILLLPLLPLLPAVVLSLRRQAIIFYSVTMQSGADGSDIFQEKLFLRDFSIAKQTLTYQTFKNIQTQARSKHGQQKEGKKKRDYGRRERRQGDLRRAPGRRSVSTEEK